MRKFGLTGPKHLDVPPGERDRRGNGLAGEPFFQGERLMGEGHDQGEYGIQRRCE